MSNLVKPDYTIIEQRILASYPSFIRSLIEQAQANPKPQELFICKDQVTALAEHMLVSYPFTWLTQTNITLVQNQLLLGRAKLFNISNPSYKMSVRYKIKSCVKSIEQITRVVGARMVNGQAVQETEDLGWFVCFEGSWERLHLGWERPTLTKGQQVEITIEGL